MAGPGAHSPVGGSGIGRVIACQASVRLSQGLIDEESDHAALGTAVHRLIENCLLNDEDGWEWIGGRVDTVPGGCPVTRDMAIGAQVMLDAVRTAHPERNQGNFFVERHFHCRTIHELFYSTSDVVYLEYQGEKLVALHVWDYKNGVTLVEANAAQLKYYACGVMEDLLLWDKVFKVVLHVVQPNGFHADGQVRQFETNAEDLCEWLEETCIPGIDAALALVGKTLTAQELLDVTVSGDHCRFCPVRSRACPRLMSDLEELEVVIKVIEEEGADALTDEFVGRYLALWEKGKIALAAANKTAFARLMAGQRIPGYKLMHGKANRTWKDTVEVFDAEGKKVSMTVEALARDKLGSQAFTTPELKSPNQIEQLPLGKSFATQFAFKPDGGLRVAKESEAGPKVSVDTKSMFKPVLVSSR